MTQDEGGQCSCVQAALVGRGPKRAGEENWRPLMGFMDGKDLNKLHRVERGSKEMIYSVRKTQVRGRRLPPGGSR